MIRDLSGVRNELVHMTRLPPPGRRATLILLAIPILDGGRFSYKLVFPGAWYRFNTQRRLTMIPGIIYQL